MVALNMSDSPQEFAGVAGSIVLATDRAREGSALTNGLTLAPWSGVVVAP
jgi:hypothetical protein